jgi:hypothetical protein
MSLNEAGSEVRAAKHLCRDFPLGMLWRKAYSSPLFPVIFVLEYATRKVEENKEGLGLNGTHQLLVYLSGFNVNA